MAQKKQLGCTYKIWACIDGSSVVASPPVEELMLGVDGGARRALSCL